MVRLVAENSCSVTTLLRITRKMGVFPGSKKKEPIRH